MNFSIPSDKRRRILYIWKIIDRPTINIDELYNFLTFELFLAPLDEVKKIIREALDLKFLVEDFKSEEVSLGESLQDEFEKWQAGGRQKIRKLHKLLNTSWRDPIEIDEKSKYEIFEEDLVEPSIKKKAGLIRSSALKIEKLDFLNEIRGKIDDKGENGQKISYSFKIFPKDRKILHDCPDYNNLRKNQKKFCIHLGRLLMKLKNKDATKTYRLLEDLVENRESWIFS